VAGVKKMSSPTNPSGLPTARRVVTAQKRLSLATGVGAVAGLGGLGLLAVFVWQASQLRPKAPTDVKTIETVKNPEQISSENASIAGRDSGNRPYEIHAATGQQDKIIDTLIHMQTVTGVFERPSGAKLDVSSKQGAYDSKTKALELEGNVVFNEGERFRATMDKASINTIDQSLQSKTPVKVDMQGTLIEADNLTVTSNGTRILFKGGVKAKFNMKTRTTGDGG
jgi:lipopolysaccharide export system protein LptC